MESQREVERKYNVLLKKVKNDDFYKVELSNRVNCYTCYNGHITKTKDIDAGVTPMFHVCETCGERAISTFYKDIAPDKEPTQEWFRPSLKEVLKMRDKPYLLDHIFNGGLNIRPIKNKITMRYLIKSIRSG